MKCTYSSANGEVKNGNFWQKQEKQYIHSASPMTHTNIDITGFIQKGNQNDLLQAIINALEDATVEINVLVPSRSYYARQGDFDETTIDVIDPRKFQDALHLLKS